MQKLQPIKQHFNRHNPIKVEFSDFDKGTATGRLRLIAPKQIWFYFPKQYQNYFYKSGNRWQ